MDIFVAEYVHIHQEVIQFVSKLVPFWKESKTVQWKEGPDGRMEMEAIWCERA